MPTDLASAFPLVVATGTGANSRKPFGFIILGGILASEVIKNANGALFLLVDSNPERKAAR
jgi:hypothetical protein